MSADLNIERHAVSDRILRALVRGPLYRGALELVIGAGDLTVELRALLTAQRIEIAREIGPATYRLREPKRPPAGEDTL